MQQLLLWHQLLRQQPLLCTVPFRRRRCNRSRLPCRSRLTSLPVSLRLLTWPGAVATSCPSPARSVPLCERFLPSSPPRLISDPVSLRSASIIHLELNLLFEGLTNVLKAFGVQGLHCLTQMSNESLILTRLSNDPEKGKRESKKLHMCPKVRRNPAHT